MRKSEIAALLPGVFLRTLDPEDPTQPLDAVLDAMETLHEPSEEAITDFARQLDPTLCRPDFLTLLSRWMYLDRGVVPSDETALRRLIQEASDLWRWRGTRSGLERFIELVHGRPPSDIDESARPFHLVVTFPKVSSEDRMRLDLAIRIMKPAHVTYELRFEEAP